MSVDYRPDYDPADVDSDYGHTGGNITVPTFTGDTRPFRFWCQKALPLVYDDSLSYYEVLCKMADYMNNFVTDLTTVEDSMTEFGQQFVINQQFLNSMADQLGQNVADLEAYINDRMDDFMTAYTQLQTYVNNYFDNLDVQEEINTKLDEMASDGTLNDLFDPVLETWMQQKTAQIDSAIANQDTIQAAQNSRISVLEGRMDTFSSLPAGSTSGNAELLDIRTNFLGETFGSAGDAVRTSDLVASGYTPLAITSYMYDGQPTGVGWFDVTKYKGGRIAFIANIAYNSIIWSQYNGLLLKVSDTNTSVYDGHTMSPDNEDTYYYENFIEEFYEKPLAVYRHQEGAEMYDSSRVLCIFKLKENFPYKYIGVNFSNESDITTPLVPIIRPDLISYGTYWLETPIDPTLSVSGEAADAKATGDALSELNERINTENELLHDKQSVYSNFVQGVRYVQTPDVISNTSTRCTVSKPISMNEGDELSIVVPSGFKIAIVTSTNAMSGWQSTDYTYKAPANVNAFVNVAKTDDSAITTADFSINVVFSDYSSRITKSEDDITVLNDSTGTTVITGWVYGSYIKTSESTYTPDSPYVNAGYRYVFVDCSEGDLFTINGTGGGAPRLWAFADDENNILSKANSLLSARNLIIKAPANATRLIINDQQTEEYCYKGKSAVANIAEVQNELALVHGCLKTSNINIPWELGNIAVSANDEIIYQNDDRRVRTAKQYSLHMFPGDSVGLSDYTNTRYYVYWTNNSGTLKAIGWLTADFTIEEEGNYLFLLASNPDATQTTWHTLADLFVINKTETAKELQADIKNVVSWDYLINPCGPKFAMHRGFSDEAPENTVPAFTIAGQRGAWGIETDIWETTDGKFVCFHDATVDRMTDGTGDIASKSYAEVQALTIDAGSHISDYSNLKIPTLEEYLNICRRYGCVGLVEIKSVNDYSAMMSVIKSCGMTKSVIFIIGTITGANDLRRYTDNPIIVLAFHNTDKTKLVNNIYGHANYFVSFEVTSLSDYSVVELAHSKGIPVNVYTVDTELKAEECFNNGVDIITSDSIPKLS